MNFVVLGKKGGGIFMKRSLLAWVVAAQIFLPGQSWGVTLPGWAPPLTIKNVVVGDNGATVIVNGGVPTQYLMADPD
jgi:hypothetical protein